MAKQPLVAPEHEAPQLQETKGASGKAKAGGDGKSKGAKFAGHQELCRSASMDMAALTGRTREVARAALDVVGDDHDSACRLLMTDLALTWLSGRPCEIAPLEIGAAASLGGGTAPKVLSVGAFGGCSLLRVDPAHTDDLQLFALEPVDICVLTQAKAPIASGWSMLESTDAPEVEGMELGLSVQSCSFDPGNVTVPLGEVRLAAVRLVEKPGAAPPANTVAPRSPVSGEGLAEGAAAEDTPLSASPAPVTPVPEAKGSLAKRTRIPEVENEGDGASPEKRGGERRQGRTDRGFQDVRQVGMGSFGTVHLALDKEGHEVAVKRVKIVQGRHLREAKLLKTISHPCVVGLIDAFEAKGTKGDDGPVMCIVMEYLPENLHQRIGGKPLEAKDFRCFSFQLLRGLAHLDAVRVCHRDVKPENVLLASRSLKLADFGSAKVLDVQAPSTSYICSRWWRAPELVLGAVEYTTSVDWWSCGCVCAEMLLGRSLFMGASSWGQMYQIIRALGTPSMDEVKALNPSCSGRMAEHLNKLAELRRPAKPWAELLPAYAHMPDALQLPARLLAYDPGRRCHPREALGWGLFSAMPEDPDLPEAIFGLTAEELGACGSETRAAVQDLEARRSRRAAVRDLEVQVAEGDGGITASAAGLLEAAAYPPESSPEAEAEYAPKGPLRSCSRAARRGAAPYARSALDPRQRRAQAAEPPSPGGQKRRRLLVPCDPTPTPILVRLNTGDVSDIP